MATRDDDVDDEALLAIDLSQYRQASCPPSRHRYFWGRSTKPSHHDPSCFVEPGLYFCSNFFPASISIDGQVWKTVEHYYQSCKYLTTNPSLVESIRAAPTPMKAKQLARLGAGKCRKDWDKVRLASMRKALKAKFTQNPTLRDKLCATHPDILHEDAPTDPFWGVCGEDHLGKMLCELRSELRGNEEVQRTWDVVQ